ncbi:MAG: hypothetical protein HOP35_15275 [Nitrospira sp.]|nr:hypothetical protein [Nitrospira sp.]
MIEIVLADSQLPLADQVSKAIVTMIAHANANQRCCLLNADVEARTLHEEIVRQQSGWYVSFGHGEHCVFPWETALAVAWAGIRRKGREYRVARCCVERNRSDRQSLAFRSLDRARTPLCAVLGLNKGRLGVYGLTRESDSADLDHLVIRLAAKGLPNPEGVMDLWAKIESRVEQRSVATAQSQEDLHRQ